MAFTERSFSDVLQDIVRDIQGIVRSEVKLAKGELLDEFAKIKAAAPLLIVGCVASLLGILFLVWTVVYALALVLPIWAAVLIVGAVFAIAGSLALAASLKALRKVDPKPERTIASVKENVQWAKQQVK